MGTADTLNSPQYIQTRVWGVHDGTADGTAGEMWKVGGRYSATAAAVGDGDAALMWVDDRGRVHPHLDAYLLDSATTATGSATGTTSRGLGVFSEMDVMARVTVGTGTSATMDMFLDSRLDGTNYINVAHLTKFTGADTVVAHLSRRQGTSLELVDVDADAGAGTIRRIGWGDDLRVRRDITGTSPQFSYTVYINSVA